MLVVSHLHLPLQWRGDCSVRIVAGPEIGAASPRLSAWTVPPGGATALCCGHDRLVIAIALEGCGKLRVGGAPQSFRAPCTLIAAANVEREIVNTGAVALRLLVLEAADGGEGGQRSSATIGRLTP
jgi:quercetin dioxygenase-like cupin family protein